MYESLDTLLRLALIHDNHKDKATVKKFTLKLLRKVAPHVKLEIMDSVMADKDQFAAYVWHANRYVSLNNTANEIAKKGFIGMIMHDGIAYPIQVIIQDPQDREWAIANERTIVHMVGQNTAKELQIDGDTCEVIMFKNAGFSGVRYRIVAQSD